MIEKLKNKELELDEFKDWEKYIADVNIGA